MTKRLINEEGKRGDGRRLDELRPLKIETGVLKSADGSAYVEWGGNKVMVAVYGPRQVHPRHLQDPNKAIVQCRYNMAPFSVGDRKRPGPDRRSVEISKILSEALGHVIFVERFPKTAIDIYIEVLQANAGTRCAGLTGASVALADAGIPMRDMIASVAVGKIDGQIALDLYKDEDQYGDADLPIGYVPTTGEVVLLQMDGHMTHDEFFTALDIGIEAAKKVYEVQREALKRRYAPEVMEFGEDEDSVIEENGGEDDGEVESEPTVVEEHGGDV